MKYVCGFFLMLTLFISACGTTPLNTTTFEERYLRMGYSNRMMQYGQTMLDQGRYPEAMAAFFEAEQAAYTGQLRAQARDRRMWLQDVLAASKNGHDPFAGPNDQTPTFNDMIDLSEPAFSEQPLVK